MCQNLYKGPLKLRMGMSNLGTWSLTVEDEKSGLIVLIVNLTPEQLGTMLGTREVVVTDTVVTRDERIGKQHVHVEKLIPANGISSNSKAAVQDFTTRCKFMTDRGWQPDADNFNNYHRRERIDGETFQRVIFRKYVDYDSPLAERYREWLNAGGYRHPFEISDEE